ncbi:hypothetical protein IKE72_00335 [Candidatus Saccharibacteria bacterium]|nr:hypothetical protein [Candidatus Saccharibacteria bacterium]
MNESTTGMPMPMAAGFSAGGNPALNGMPVMAPPPIGGVMGPTSPAPVVSAPPVSSAPISSPTQTPPVQNQASPTPAPSPISDQDSVTPSAPGLDQSASDSPSSDPSAISAESPAPDSPALASDPAPSEPEMMDIPEEEKDPRQGKEVLDSDVVVKPTTQAADLEIRDKEKQNLPEVQKMVIQHLKELHNVLIALSSNPSVDELAAAIGITIYLDKIGKRATAIYSGDTPNALEFLNPEETFDQSADVLQDFVIALNKDKADHLRYKLDGDFVRIYITPYRAKITAEDLEYSYGDYNVDLVLALDVANGIDLDEALREHGRIMHDAVVVDVTTGNPGKLGEIAWTDKTASSISEMLAGMIFNMDAEPIGEEEATAFLTGIVAATNRFMSVSTTPRTMEIASRLMNSGAKHQLISKNITSDVSNEQFQTTKREDAAKAHPLSEDADADETSIHADTEPSDIPDDDSDKEKDLPVEDASVEDTSEEVKTEDDAAVSEDGELDTVGPLDDDEKVGPIENENENVGLIADDIVGPLDSSDQVGPLSNDDQVGPIEDDTQVGPISDEPEVVGPINNDDQIGPIHSIKDEATSLSPEMPTVTADVAPEDTSLLNDIKAAEESLKGAGAETISEQTSAPMMIEDGEMVREVATASASPAPEAPATPAPEAPASPAPEPSTAPLAPKQEKILTPSEESGSLNKYGKMLEDALNGVTSGDTDTNMPDMGNPLGVPGGVPDMSMPSNNIAETSAPAVPTTPEINGVPEMNYMPMPGDQVLPPPPTPPIDMNGPVNSDGLVMPAMEPSPAPQPTMDVNPAAFQVPGGMNAPVDTSMDAMAATPQMATAPTDMMGTLPNVTMDAPVTPSAPIVTPMPTTGPTPAPATAMNSAMPAPSAPAAEPAPDLTTSEPYDPTAFRIPGIK